MRSILSSAFSMISFYTMLSLFVTGNALAQPTCQEQGVASCVSEDGMCIDFFEMPGSDIDLWESACASFEGEFFEDKGCSRENVALSCLNPNNMLMPLMHFYQDADLDGAQMMCTMMGGSVCP